jgi:hypothetical protein
MTGGVYRNCQLLSMTLNEVGFENVALHAMIRQKERLAALTRFRSNIIRILIATDVASRGGYLLILHVFIIFSKSTYIIVVLEPKARDHMEDLGVNGRTVNMWLCYLYPLSFASWCTSRTLDVYSGDACFEC